MSEVASRPSASRGRGSGRGGRGGFAGRGGRRTNGDSKPDTKSTDGPVGAFDDEGDVSELRKLYGPKTGVIREMFPDWSEVDVLFALQETNGDENEAVTRIAEGNISQWGEVSKVKKPKSKDTTAPAPTTTNESSTAPSSRPARGGRVVSEGGRGRGRATDRGGRGGRGGRPAAQPATNGTRATKEAQPLSVPTEESNAWTAEKPAAAAVATPDEAKAAPAAAPAAAAPQAKTWASMLRQSTKPPPKPQPPQEAPAPAPAEPAEPQTTAATDAPSAAEDAPAETETQPEPAAAAAEETTPVAQEAVPSTAASAEEPSVPVTPSHDDLTKKNLEQVIDVSEPPATHTAASTTADSWDPRQSTTATPLSAAQQQHQAQRQTSGYAATASKAANDRAVRTPTHQRRVLHQEEAVRMPGNREVDRTAVQFGAFNLGGGDDDVDGEREEAETRAQPPVDSPVSHPRAALPPTAPDASQKTPGAAVPQAPASQYQGPNAAAAQSQQYGRFGQPGAQDGAQKPLDPFAQQAAPAAQPPFDSFAAQTSQPPSQPVGAGLSSAPSDYSSYYTANQQDRNPYAYYGQFGQQQGQQDSIPGQQRPFGAYGGSQADNLSQYPQSGIHSQPRFGAAGNDAAQNSGHNTPNPTAQAAQQQAGQPPAGAAPGTQPQHSHAQQYPGYNHPYFSNPYYHQYYSGYGQGGFGPYGGKGGMYQPYGMSPSAPFDHASSPASFAQSSLHRDSGIGSGLGDYGRAGAGAASQATAGGAPGLGGSSFGSVNEGFSRGASSFQSQGQGFSGQGQPGSTGASGDDLKPYGDKGASGPSPSIGGARPGSAAATNAPAGQAGGPPPQTQMGAGAYAGYPNHLQGLHGSSAYGMGAAGATQHGSTPYGSYNQGGFGSNPYGSYGQGQGQGQQRGGWGGNYH